MVERILALDVGDKRIGLAITDALRLTAQPLFTLHRTTQRADLKAIARFIRQHGVTTVVVGNPLNADGTPSRQSEKAQAFAKVLEAEHPELEHHLLDERLTTREAHDLLDMAGRTTRAAGAPSRKDLRLSRTEIIDQVAATLLLEAFLSQRSGPALLPEL
jgi:putative Holliday junction resolvase